MYYDCQIKVGDRSIYYSTVFWQPPHPPPPPTPTPPPANPTSKSKRGCQSMKMRFFKSSWQKELFHIIFSDHLWLPVLIQGRINILWCYILTPTTTYPSKSQIGCHFIKMLFFFVGFHVKMNHFTLFLAMYYDCLVKVRGGSIYYGIIFWPFCPQPNLHQKVKGDVIPWKCIFQVFMIKWTISHYLRRSFMIACSNAGAGQYIYGIIFWTPPPPTPQKIK